MKFIGLALFCINILHAFGLVQKDQNSKDCKNLNKFFDEQTKLSGQNINLPTCCDSTKDLHYIKCENGYVTEIDLRMSKYENVSFDFSKFPNMSKLNKLIIEGRIFKNGTLPANIFDLPNLNDLEIKSSNIVNIPENINKNCPLKKLSLYHNEIIGFPEQLMSYTKLKYLNLSKNSRIRSIPSSISNLKDLQFLYIGMTGLTSLSESIFDLPKLKELDLDGNKNLYTRVFNFGSKVEECDFRDINVMCYEPGTCEKLIIGQQPKQYNFEPEKLYKACDSPRVTSYKEEKSFFSKYLTTFIIAGLVGIIVIILSILICVYRRYRKSKTNVNKQVTDINENEMEEDIYVTPIPLSKYMRENTMKVEDKKQKNIEGERDSKSKEFEIIIPAINDTSSYYVPSPTLSYSNPKYLNINYDNNGKSHYSFCLNDNNSFINNSFCSIDNGYTVNAYVVDNNNNLYALNGLLLNNNNFVNHSASTSSNISNFNNYNKAINHKSNSVNSNNNVNYNNLHSVKELESMRERRIMNEFKAINDISNLPPYSIEEPNNSLNNNTFIRNSSLVIKSVQPNTYLNNVNNNVNMNNINTNNFNNNNNNNNNNDSTENNNNSRTNLNINTEVSECDITNMSISNKNSTNKKDNK